MSAAQGPPSRTPGFADPLGQRIISGDQTTGLVETLWICPEFAHVAAFERAVRDGIVRLGSFANPFCGRVRRLDRGDGPDAGLALVSDYVEGNRLSEILILAEQQQIQINTSATLDIVSQLATVIAALHDHAVGGFHGLLGPERIVVRPDTQIVVVEHVLGPAFRRLPHHAPEEHWRRFRFAVPADPTLPPFGPRTDVVQIGIVALSLVLGRQLRAGEYPGRVSELLAVATETDLVGRRRPLGEELRNWIAGLLQLDPDHRFKTMAEANEGLDRVLADEDRYIAAPIALAALVRPRHHRTPGARRVAAQPHLAPDLDEPDPVLAQLVASTPAPEPPPASVVIAESSAPSQAAPGTPSATVAPVGAEPGARTEPAPEPELRREVESPADGIAGPGDRLPVEVAIDAAVASDVTSGTSEGRAAATAIPVVADVRAAGDAAIGMAAQDDVTSGDEAAPEPASQIVEAKDIPAVVASPNFAPAPAETAAVMTPAEPVAVEASSQVVAMTALDASPVEAPAEAEQVAMEIASVQVEGPRTGVAADLLATVEVPEASDATEDTPTPVAVTPLTEPGEMGAAAASKEEPPAGFTEEIPPSRFTPLFESNGVQTVADRLAAMPPPEEAEPPLVALGRELESSATTATRVERGRAAGSDEPAPSTPAPAMPAPSRRWSPLPAQPARAEETPYVPVETVTLHEFFERTQHGASGAVAPPRPAPVASAGRPTPAVRPPEPVAPPEPPAETGTAIEREPEIIRDAFAGPVTSSAVAAVGVEPVAATVTGDREVQAPPGRRFLVETEVAPPRRPALKLGPAGPTPPARRWVAPVLAAAALLIVASVGLSVTVFRKVPPREAATETGTLSVTSRPPGAEVVVDGESRGHTPVSLRLAPGRYRLEVRGASEARQSTVEVKSGSEVAESFTLEEGATPTGAIQVVTKPAGAQVSVDGTARGKTPVTVDNLEPGSHAIEVTGDFGTIDRNVTVEAGKTLTVNVPIVGYARIQSPLSLEVLENGKVLGTVNGGPIQLAPGLHNLAFVHDAVAFRSSQLVVIEAGQTTTVKVDLPDGIVNLNAIPWAEVWIDGEKVGDTPIANLSMKLGPHQVVFRNPKFGEMRYDITVSLAAPVRLSVDFAKK